MTDDSFFEAVGAVATGAESLPEAAERRGVDATDVAKALSRYANREDYDGRLWTDRRDEEGVTPDVDEAIEMNTEPENL